MLKEIIDKNHINNAELLEIINFIKEEPIFITENVRLLSKDEIINYKKELNTEKEIIPIIDLYDNNYLVFNIEIGNFQILDISVDEYWKEVSSIKSYIDILKEKS